MQYKTFSDSLHLHWKSRLEYVGIHHHLHIIDSAVHLVRISRQPNAIVYHKKQKLKSDRRSRRDTKAALQYRCFSRKPLPLKSSSVEYVMVRGTPPDPAPRSAQSRTPAYVFKCETTLEIMTCITVKRQDPNG